jgi:putative hemolysin
VLAALGRLPVVGDAVTVEGRELTVLELDGRRIARLSVSPAPRADADTDGVAAESASG